MHTKMHTKMHAFKDCIADVNLMFDNCFTFNDASTEVPILLYLSHHVIHYRTAFRQNPHLHSYPTLPIYFRHTRTGLCCRVCSTSFFLLCHTQKTWNPSGCVLPALFPLQDTSARPSPAVSPSAGVPRLQLNPRRMEGIPSRGM